MFFCFVFFQDEFPLASLPLIGYSVARPVEVIIVASFPFELL